MEYIGKIPNSKYSNFYHVPTMEHLIINTKGVVINTVKDITLKTTVRTGYKCIGTAAIHRMLALTFLPDPGVDTDTLDVNHKDGDKLNNDLPNLEWATRSENCIHAYITGLRNDNRPVLVKDLEDGTVERYYSLQACARAFNTSGSRIFNCLKERNRGKVYFNNYSFIYEGQEWPDMSIYDACRCQKGRPKLIVATNSITKEKMVFESVASANRHFGYSETRLAMHMFRNKDKPLNNWIFNVIDDPKIQLKPTFPSPPKKTWKRKLVTPPKLKVTNLETGQADVWETSKKFAEFMNVNKNTMQALALRHNGVWKNFKLEYLFNNN